MLKQENNQSVSNTIINESLSTRCVTLQQSAHTENEASVSNNIPLGSTYVTTKVSKPIISYRKHFF